MSTDASFRPALAGDAEQIRWGLYEALAWNPERELPAPEATLEHPEAARYHRDWGRGGDLGVIASVGGELVGVAYCRLFTEDDHGHGYVDAETPEVAVAVRDGWRGTGLGTRLLEELAVAALEQGFDRLSLSVDHHNPARRLYERLGYRDVGSDDGGVRMLLELKSGHSVEAFVETAAGRIYVEREGDASARPVVLAAGGPGVGHDHYHPWFSQLAPQSLVVYFDYSGCGRSDRLDTGLEYSVALFAENIDAVRQHLGAESIDLIGLSFGGMPAVEYALRHPGVVRRLVLSNAQISAETWQRTNIDGVNAELRRLFPQEWQQILLLREQGVGSLDPEYQRLVSLVLPDLEWVDPWNHPPLRQSSGVGFEERVYRSVIGADPEWVVDGTLAGYDPLPRLRDLQARTLVIGGRYDRVTPPSVAHAIHEALPGDRRELRIFERSAHRPWAEQPEEYFDVVGRFLR